ncbi:hypothetical protein RZS08_67385, partial [Arthrospira platensis SPKY1]|nr:hypothetical protein [Arthrospira platensis SPKY1]
MQHDFFRAPALGDVVQFNEDAVNLSIPLVRDVVDFVVAALPVRIGAFRFEGLGGTAERCSHLGQ